MSIGPDKGSHPRLKSCVGYINGMLAGFCNGKKQRVPRIVVFEFRNGKVQQAHDYHDRLLIAQQLADGWFEKKIINAVVNRMGKDLG